MGGVNGDDDAPTGAFKPSDLGYRMDQLAVLLPLIVFKAEL